MKPRSRATKEIAQFRTCIVCGRSNKRFPFERFAPCSPNCKTIFYASSRIAPLRSIVARRHLCPGAVNNMVPPWDRYHRPTKTPRVHVLYCSLKCYNHTERGHDARRLASDSYRHQRYWAKRGSKSAIMSQARQQKAIDEARMPWWTDHTAANLRRKQQPTPGEM